MKRFLVIAGIMVGCMFGFSDSSQAAPRIGIEGTLGKSSLGVVLYEDTYSGGVFFGQEQDEALTVQRSTTTVGAWAGLRHKLEARLFFNYGVNAYLRTGVVKAASKPGEPGTAKDLEIFGISPFIGFDYEATPHFLLTAWCNLYDYNTTNIKTVAASTTTSIFQSYAGIVYLF